MYVDTKGHHLAVSSSRATGLSVQSKSEMNVVEDSGFTELVAKLLLNACANDELSFIDRDWAKQ